MTRYVINWKGILMLSLLPLLILIVVLYALREPIKDMLLKLKDKCKAKLKELLQRLKDMV